MVPDGRSVSIASGTADVMPIMPACQALIARKDCVSSQAWHDLFGHGVIYVSKKNNKAYDAVFFIQILFRYEAALLLVPFLFLSFPAVRHGFFWLL